MKKRISAICTATAILSTYGVCHAADVTVGEFNCIGNEVTVTGQVSEMCSLTLTVVKKGGNPSVDAVAIDEQKIDGKFTFNFGMPERESISDDYVVYLRASGGEEESVEFSYASLAEQKVISESLEIPGNISSVLDNEENKVAAECLGVDMELWAECTDDMKEDIQTLAEGGEDTDIVALVNKAIYLVSYNNEKDAQSAKSVLEKLNFKWEDTAFSDMSSSRQSEVNKHMMETVSYDSFTDAEDRFAEVNGLYDIGNAKKGEIEAVLEKYADVLGYENDSEYKEYKDLSSKSSVNTKIVNKLYSDNPYTVDGLMDIIDDALNAKSGSSGGSGGGGGGSSSKAPSVSVNNVAGLTSPSTTISGSEEKEDSVSLSDLEDASWAKEYIESLVSKGVLKGYDDGTFRPNGTITREEFITMIVRAGDFPTTGVFCDFKDVDRNAWYYVYVASGYSNGLMTGVDKEYMGIGSNITRQDMAVIIERAMGKRNLSFTKGSPITFVDAELISDYAKESVNNLTAMGIINGKGDGFDPHGNLTRAEAAKVLYMVFFNK